MLHVCVHSGWCVWAGLLTLLRVCPPGPSFCQHLVNIKGPRQHREACPSRRHCWRCRREIHGPLVRDRLIGESVNMTPDEEETVHVFGDMSSTRLLCIEILMHTREGRRGCKRNPDVDRSLSMISSVVEAETCMRAKEGRIRNRLFFKSMWGCITLLSDTEPHLTSPITFPCWCRYV